MEPFSRSSWRTLSHRSLSHCLHTLVHFVIAACRNSPMYKTSFSILTVCEVLIYFLRNDLFRMAFRGRRRTVLRLCQVCCHLYLFVKHQSLGLNEMVQFILNGSECILLYQPSWLFYHVGLNCLAAVVDGLGRQPRQTSV